MIDKDEIHIIIETILMHPQKSPEPLWSGDSVFFTVTSLYKWN